MFFTGVCRNVDDTTKFCWLSGTDMLEDAIALDCSPPVRFSSDLVCLSELPIIFVGTGDVYKSSTSNTSTYII